MTDKTDKTDKPLTPEDLEDLRKAGPEAEQLAREAAQKLGVSLSDFLFIARMRRKMDALRERRS